MSASNIAADRLCAMGYKLAESAVSSIECIPLRWMGKMKKTKKKRRGRGGGKEGR